MSQDSKKLVQLTVAVEPGQKKALEDLAVTHGFIWGSSKPNISALIRAIGDGRISLSLAESNREFKKRDL